MNTEDKYISVNEFKKTLANLDAEGFTPAVKKGIEIALSDAVPQLLDDEPAADVKPVKHGRWKEEEPRELVCSLCGKYAPMNFMHQHCVETAYCPHCGARMDKE